MAAGRREGDARIIRIILKSIRKHSCWHVLRGPVCSLFLGRAWKGGNRGLLLTLVFALLVWALTACSLPATPPASLGSPPVASPIGTSATPVPEPTRVHTPLPQPGSSGTAASEVPEEAILIVVPGPGSRVTSPLHVAGIADSTFEQALLVRLLLEDGSLLAAMLTSIAAPPGERGPFQADLPFQIDGERQAFLQVFSVSPRDGEATHLASVGLAIADSGPTRIVELESHAERIAIWRPYPDEELSGGVAHVEGFALASFEGTLLIEVVDETGTVIGSQPVTVSAPEMGVPGPFGADVTFAIAQAGPGRVVVRDISPAFGGDVHRSSVEVTLSP